MFILDYIDPKEKVMELMEFLCFHSYTNDKKQRIPPQFLISLSLPFPFIPVLSLFTLPFLIPFQI